MIYPINFVGHDEWLNSGYALDQAEGEVVSRDGEVLGHWRVVDYDPNDDSASGRYEFSAFGHDSAMFAERFAYLDLRTSRGSALSAIVRAVQEWHESQVL